MTTRILAVYDRSPLGDLAVESAFQFARTCEASTLIVLAAPEVAGDIGQRESLHDDLLMFVRLGQRLGIAVDGDLIDVPDAEHFATEMRRWRIDHVIIVEPIAENCGSAMERMSALDAAAEAAGVTTIVVREENP